MNGSLKLIKIVWKQQKFSEVALNFQGCKYIMYNSLWNNCLHELQKYLELTNF